MRTRKVVELALKGALRAAGVSRRLRRDRELAFYGAEDLTPFDFYYKGDAEDARCGARFVVRTVRPHVR